MEKHETKDRGREIMETIFATYAELNDKIFIVAEMGKDNLDTFTFYFCYNIFQGPRSNVA